MLTWTVASWRSPGSPPSPPSGQVSKPLLVSCCLHCPACIRVYEALSAAVFVLAALLQMLHIFSECILTPLERI